MNEDLCKYGELAKENGVEYLRCTLVDGYCSHIRFCQNDMCIKMSSSSDNCKQKKIREFANTDSLF